MKAKLVVSIVVLAALILASVSVAFAAPPAPKGQWTARIVRQGDSYYAVTVEKITPGYRPAIFCAKTYAKARNGQWWAIYWAGGTHKYNLTGGKCPYARVIEARLEETATRGRVLYGRISVILRTGIP
ncbi:hypothetical protein A3D84_02395 [Candidatus Woesebacteria bacterium RIFCSPHIGHO2_02_FULL_42_20]|uniref:Uncharacterized protein n=1 Tax=Candidatus Woesebacteria bacterium RIFCSPHIGHO2_12_FULL_41_24 TaxID=1802510 RepID=A0A1F8ATG3_9BACT|nr:MAG: hypothetical protein A2W15_00035 [Candidatus Woesebacteria bacterium RBG_16_41_13]OGM29439.1 MAG: hypothetical protein A2873_05100 [Candidatus Woesebacteria bacterium RIFCSPHIGHO2_01_FULL_42_80]OGM35018.1 MAG: hypothetical protein A3D84_02395 [Candidatus Woesebacteria bacterium RIFCSPHIGHO2_02_FULL_42_20]OGM54789.1 MAG: hypothetical protein A3E44_01370 [Candidatus Woesebacteria bacterium RIFCSPHIGHO2_12_FULL_41_24]OGM68333.1 MAG: hypothetical protein A2969_03010 [Candidatus Woesebacteri